MANSNDEASAKRDGARRARRLAGQLPDDADRARLLAFADELEAAAEALERGSGHVAGEPTRPAGGAPGGRRRPPETDPTGN